MKNPNSKLIFIAICFVLLAVAAPAQAEETKTIHLKVAAFDNVLFDNNFTVNACPDTNDASSTNLTVNAWCATEQLTSSQSWSATSTWYSYGIMLNSLNQYDGSDGNYWLWFADSEIGATALNQHLLTDGENLLLAYGTGPLKISVSSTTPAINSTSTINASYFDANAWQWQPAASSTFLVNGQETASGTEAYELWTSTTTPYVITAKKAGFLDSDPVTITPQLPTTNIKLRIETASSTLFNQNFNVSACEENTNSGIYTLNARCAIDQSGLAARWTEWGSDSFLDSIGSYSNNLNGNGVYWLWFSNLDLGQTSLNKHILSENEELLLIYDINPLKITTATTTPYTNSTSTLLLEQFGLDSNWNPVWEPATSSTFLINNQEFFSADGTFGLFISTSSPYSIQGSKTGYLDSPVLILNGVIQESTSTEPVSTSTPVGTSTPPNSGPGSADSHQTINVGSAVNFLIVHQNNDGSIGSSVLYSDWASLALAAYGDNETKNKLKNYLASIEPDAEFNSSITNSERRAMALMALGINPYNGTKTDYIMPIVSAFDGSQIGDPSIFNDDIFALFPLLKAGYSGSDPIIDTAIKFIISKQNADGSWESVDLTAATIQALVLAQKTGNLSSELGNSISRSLLAAKNFLRGSQGANGGFNNSFSTSWAIQAIVALGEPVFSWENSGKNPIDFLASYQKNDGGFEDTSTAVDTRIWSTIYTIPAALYKTWGDLLNIFSKPALSLLAANNSSEGSNEVLSSNNNIATSTPDIATSTPDIATSTPAIENTTTTVISILPEKTTTSSPAIQNQFKNNSNTAVVPPPPTEQKKPEITQIPQPLEAQLNASPILQNLTAVNTARIVFYLSTAIVVSLGLYLLIKFFWVL